MGLDFSHCKAHWSYSGFKIFREKLWNSCGFTGRLYDLYYNKIDESEPFKDQIRIDHPLYDFFNHSDCDGQLTVEQMNKIIPKMKSVIENWEDDYDKQQAKFLIDGMKEAILRNENLEFH